ncbi:MAG: hypothetical protein WBG92_02165 [Thiohalocapsa sp.]
MVCVGFGWAVLFLAPLYPHQVFAFPSYQVGLLLLPMTAMPAIMPAVAGKLYDSRGVEICIALIALLAVVSYALQLLSNDLSRLLFVLVLFGAAWGTGNGIGVPVALSNRRDGGNTGVVSDAAITVLNIGGVMSLSLIATVFHSVQIAQVDAHANKLHAFTEAYDVSIALLLVLSVVLLSLAAWFGRRV